MPRYFVPVEVVYLDLIRIEADSPEQAVQMIIDGDIPTDTVWDNSTDPDVTPVGKAYLDE